jgi:hypothetical protein
VFSDLKEHFLYPLSLTNITFYKNYLLRYLVSQYTTINNVLCTAQVGNPCGIRSVHTLITSPEVSYTVNHTFTLTFFLCIIIVIRNISIYPQETMSDILSLILGSEMIIPTACVLFQL